MEHIDDLFWPLVMQQQIK